MPKAVERDGPHRMHDERHADVCGSQPHVVVHRGAGGDEGWNHGQIKRRDGGIEEIDRQAFTPRVMRVWCTGRRKNCL